MGLTYANTKLINADDSALARRNVVEEEKIRALNLTILVDRGVYMIAINETIQSQLDLPLIEMRKVQVADSRVVEYPVVGPIHVRFANRKAT